MHNTVRVQTTINGEPQEFLCEPRQSLLECLRDILGLTGTKEGCNDGNCGACTVLMDENAALQCGVCTPGFIMTAKALLDREPNPSEEQIRLWLANNLCRCTGYDKIIRAVEQAAQEARA